MTTGIPVCISPGCARLLEWPYCEAFLPGLIPALIGSGQNDHREPIDGDHGLQFKPLDESEPET